MDTPQDIDQIAKIKEERDKARNLAALLEEELSQALERIETLNSRIAGITAERAEQ